MSMSSLHKCLKRSLLFLLTWSCFASASCSLLAPPYQEAPHEISLADGSVHIDGQLADIQDAATQDEPQKESLPEQKVERFTSDCDCVKTIYTFDQTSGYRDGNAEQARFGSTSSVALDPDNKVLYIADNKNKRVRRLDLKTGVVSTLAGSGEQAPEKGNKYKDGPGHQATFFQLWSIAFDTKRKRLYVAEGYSCRVRAIDLQGVVSTILPSCGEKGDFEDPYDQTIPDYGNISMGYDGHLYQLGIRNALRRINFEIKRVEYITRRGSGSGGDVTDGPIEKASFPYAKYFTMTPDGSAWLAPGGNATTIAAKSGGYRIRKIDIPHNMVSTVAGNGEPDQVDGPKEKSRTFMVYGLAYSGSYIYFFDNYRMGGLGEKPKPHYGYYLRRLDVSTNEVVTLGGASVASGIKRGEIRDGSIKEATYPYSSNIVADNDGNLYFLERRSIRRIKTNCQCK